MNPTPDSTPDSPNHVFEVHYSERDDGTANFRICAEGVPKAEAIGTIVSTVGALASQLGIINPTNPDPEAP